MYSLNYRSGFSEVFESFNVVEIDKNIPYFYFSICIFIIFFKWSANTLSHSIAGNSAFKLKIDLYGRISSLPYLKLEQIGQAKLINLLNVDIPNLAAASLHLPAVWINSITIIATLSFLLYLNYEIFIFVMICLLIAIFTYQLPIKAGIRSLVKSRSYYDPVQKGVAGLILGAKELKLNARRSESYVSDEIVPYDKEILENHFKGFTYISFAETYGEIIAFLVIGVVIFYFSFISINDKDQLFGIVIALIYLTGPVGSILNALRNYKIGKVSLQKLLEFNVNFEEEVIHPGQHKYQDFKSIIFRGVCFKYPSAEGFSLKDISLKLNRGEIVIISGGNGSGKSTLSKIVTLHYPPTSGEILIDGLNVYGANLNDARNLISAIYSDFYTFPTLQNGFDLKVINNHLNRLGLAGKISITDNRFNTTLLSDGQQKRLALLSLLLEDRPVCVFDEWASDQDPHFRRVFYTEILPELKAKNKIVIVISHDDKYFDCADKLVVMDHGKIVSVKEAQWLD